MELSFFTRFPPKFSSRTEYIREDIYQCFVTDPSPKQKQIIQNISLSSLFLTGYLPDMYKFFPLLKALINKFFNVSVSTFAMYNLFGFRLIPLDENGKAIYASEDKINYFLYYVRLDYLASYQYVGEESLLESRNVHNLFGVYFSDNERRISRLTAELENLKEENLYSSSLPKQDLLLEIGEAFHLLKNNLFRKVILRKGPFWTELNQSWLEQAWLNILSHKLPLITIYYVSEDVETTPADSRTKNLLALANFMFTGSDISTSNSLSFYSHSLDEVKKVLQSLSEQDINLWFSYLSPTPQKLQNAIKQRFPDSTSLILDNVVVANVPSTTTFTQEELEEAKEVLPIKPTLSLPPLRDVKGEAYVENHPLGVQYDAIKDDWAELVSPWAISQYKRGKWTKYWF